MTDRLDRLERDVRRLRRATAALAGLLILAVLAAFRPPPQSDVIRARGLIIEDAAGRERILLGAPIPPAANRVRTDSARVRAIWAPRFPRQYLEYYRNYRHEMNGILLLDEAGFDRVALGDPVPDPNVGRRIAPSTGLAINDAEGFERTGYGLLRVEDRYRVVLGLDSDKGTEGLTLALHDGGRVGLRVHVGQQSLFLGTAPAGDRLTGIPDSLHGLVLKVGPDVRHVVNATVRR